MPTIIATGAGERMSVFPDDDGLVRLAPENKSDDAGWTSHVSYGVTAATARAVAAALIAAADHIEAGHGG